MVQIPIASFKSSRKPFLAYISLDAMASKSLIIAALFAVVCYTMPTTNHTELDKRAAGGYVQTTSGSASFTMFSGCNRPGTYPALVTPDQLTSSS